MLWTQMYTTSLYVVQWECLYLSNSNARIISIITAGTSVLNKQDLYFLADDLSVTGRHWKNRSKLKISGFQQLGLYPFPDFGVGTFRCGRFYNTGPRRVRVRTATVKPSSHPTVQGQSPSYRNHVVAQFWRSLRRRPKESGPTSVGLKPGFKTSPYLWSLSSVLWALQVDSLHSLFWVVMLINRMQKKRGPVNERLRAW